MGMIHSNYKASQRIYQNVSRAKFEPRYGVPDERAVLNGDRGEGGRRDIKEHLAPA